MFKTNKCNIHVRLCTVMYSLFFFDILICKYYFVVLFVHSSQMLTLFTFNRFMLLCFYYYDILLYALMLYYIYFILCSNALCLILYVDHSVLCIFVFCLMVGTIFLGVLGLYYFMCDITSYVCLFMGSFEMSGFGRLSLLCLEAFSLCCRSISLFLRIFCNLLSSHTLAHMILGFIYYVNIYMYLHVGFYGIMLLVYVLMLSIDVFSSVLQVGILVNIIYITVLDLYFYVHSA